MSAPEVRLEGMFMSTQLALKCDHCGIGTSAVVGDSDVMIARLKEHETTCPAIQLARLQARWDARDTALRALVEKWRERTVTVMPSTLTAADTERLTWAAAADELERALADSLGVRA